jgi:hypothetical protein
MRRAPSFSGSSYSSTTTKPKNFVWKKGPNNRYIKVRINGMDQVEEESFVTTSGGSFRRHNNDDEMERLAHMEEALLQEAMKRSMNDL